jgi:hypothetical protein
MPWKDSYLILSYDGKILGKVSGKTRAINEIFDELEDEARDIIKKGKKFKLIEIINIIIYNKYNYL